MKPARLFLLLASLSVLTGQPQFHGYLQNWTAFRMGHENDLILLRSRFRLNVSLPGEWGKGYASYDVKDDQHLRTGAPDTDLRELYIDLYFNKFDLRIGKQQVVWGKADGVFINDLVNPLDLRYFLLQDFEDIRIGVPMVKANFYMGNIALESVWLPKFESWKFAEPGSDWAFQLAPDTVYQELAPGSFIPVVFNKNVPVLPAARLKNGEFGLKASTFFWGTDLSFLILNAYQDQVIAYLDTMIRTVDQNINLQRIDLLFTPRYNRIVMYGVNFSRPFGSLVVRGETGYFNNYYFNLAPKIDPAASAEIKTVHQSDYVQAMLGIDISGPWGVNISTQYIRMQILDYVSQIQPAKRVDEWITLLLSGSFWNETARLMTLVIYDKSNQSGLGRLIFGYSVTDEVALDLGADIIWGKSSSIFGQFDKNDNLYFKLTYSY